MSDDNETGPRGPGRAEGPEIFAPPVYGPPVTAPVVWHDFARPAPGAHPMAPGVHSSGLRPTSRRRGFGSAALILLLGLGGGLGGSAVYDALADNEAAGPYAGGLADVETVELPPVETGGVQAVAEALLPSTVQIVADLDGQAGGATGSGFVLDKQGHIVTNNHVVASAAEDDGAIQVVDFDGNSYDAELVGRSTVYDLAVLLVPGATDLPPAALGRSERLRVGDGVVAFGSPLGLTSTVTAGIVSALRRPVTTGAVGDESSYINAVQTDAAINPGNSGGPLVNLRGQVVGVNSAIATNGGPTGDAGNIGVGFAIPVEQVRITADQILKTGEARYPVIGAEVSTRESSLSAGAQISRINLDTPAQAAGLAAGDVVIEVDGLRVSDGIGLIVNIRSHQPGEKVEFVYLRNGEERTTTVQLGSETG
ncbi:S1C family serine protease [Nocardioides sp.]|uniref:S1C family serine protease n=1 Tax=Nocardioides sp. TaxID=35761 RepID=UPI002B278E9E|nr:trypsin-like peptidase domain-containing protein [Nocardioides sp.]